MRGASSVDLFEHESKVLQGNPLGDPYRRITPVYLPPSYANSGRRCYPVVYVLAGFTGQGRMMLHESAWGETLPQRLDRLIDQRRMEEAIFVLPDCMTRFGGSQYVDSSATGPYESYLLSELVPAIDSRYRTGAGRGVVGKSSGGFGALRLAFKRPDIFHVCVSHSGDAAFEYCYMPDFPAAAVAIEAAGGAAAWFDEFLSRPKHRSSDHATINVLGMAAAYSPNPERAIGFDLPFDTRTAELIPRIWARWLAHDPVRVAESESCRAAELDGVFIDCGTSDQFRLYAGARQLVDRLRERGIAVLHEEFADDHFGLSYRYDSSFPWLVDTLTNRNRSTKPGSP